MDPYREEPSRWKGFHSTLINSIRDQLADKVLPNFHVHIEERVYIAVSDLEFPKQSIEPDVFVIAPSQPIGSAAMAGAITTPTLVEPVYAEEVHERFLEIRDAQNQAVLATIEILSPFNKAQGARGRKAFLHKREQVMASTTHWLELDLLRAGRRPPEVAKQSDYYALLKRGGPGQTI
jgi:hypothetical protein